MWRCVLRRIWREFWESEFAEFLGYVAIVSAFAALCVGAWRGIRALTIWVFGMETAILIGQYTLMTLCLSVCVALLFLLVRAVVLAVRRVLEIARECKE